MTESCSLSLIVPTIGRTDELARLFKSLNTIPETKRDSVEIIVVDQNGDDRVSQLLHFLPSLRALHLKINRAGLSHAKNIGLSKATGRFVCFPDDDCYFPERTFEQLFFRLESLEKQTVLLIRCHDPATGRDLLRYPLHSKRISKKTSWDSFLGPSISQFFPIEALRSAGPFDEAIGAGTAWGSGEDTDILIRVLTVGYVIEFDPSILIYHPWVAPETMNSQKRMLYAKGFGVVCMKHHLWMLLLWKTIKLAGGACIWLFRDSRQSRYFFDVLWGRLKGAYEFLRSRGTQKQC